MHKTVIAVDVDDVLADENTAIREFMNRQYGYRHTAKDYDIVAPYWGYWEKIWAVDEAEGARMHQLYVDSGVKSSHLVIPGAVEAIAGLKQSYDLVIITSRKEQLIEDTKGWLEQHFPATFSSVEFVASWTGDHKATKAKVAKSLGAKYLIDDSAEHCRSAQQSGVQALLFGGYGWNRSEKMPEGVIRVANWQEVREYFNGKQG